MERGRHAARVGVFLHHVVDLRVHQRRGRQAAGQVIVCRYADDMVLGCQFETDGKQLLADLNDKLEQFGPSLHEGKTRLIEFGWFAARNRAAAGATTGDLRLSGLYALLRQDQDEQVHGQAKDAGQARGPKAEGNPRGDATPHARSRAGAWGRKPTMAELPDKAARTVLCGGAQ